jgi:predicted metalloprotease with PDZ domain
MNWKFLTLSVFLNLIMALQTHAAPEIIYHLSFQEPHTHYVGVKIEIHQIQNSEFDLIMPVWTPGSYLIREFPKNVEQFKATDTDGNLIPIEKITKNKWRIHNGEIEDIVISYFVYANEYSVRTSFIDEDHASINPASVFMYVDGFKNKQVIVAIQPFEGWKNMTTPLQHLDNDPWVLIANGFDELVDSPIEIGNHTDFTFTAAGVPHTVAMIGIEDYNKTKLIKGFTKIIEEETKIIGEHPCESYVFFLHHTTFRDGGLEHANSTSIIVPKNTYETDENYQSLLGLIAHEYFHLWNVKRIRPYPLGPFDYSSENYSRLLWMAEGFTSYYDEKIMFRLGYVDKKQYLKNTARAINYIVNTPGNTIQSVADASFDAWIKYYVQNENSKNATVSYYSKGKLIAMCMDLFILHHSKGKYSLKDVMRQLYNTFYKEKDTTFNMHDLQQAIEHFANTEIDWFFEKHILQPNPIPYQQFLAYAGLELFDQNENKKLPWPGIKTQTSNGRIFITEVRRNSSAWIYGLNTSDEIIGINGKEVNEESFKAILKKAKVGDRITFLIVRKGELKMKEVVLIQSNAKRYEVIKTGKPSKTQKEVLNLWLGK